MKDWKHKCELKVLVCQPNPLRPDRVTVGFVLRDTNPDSPRVEVRLADNLRAVRCIYPDADLEAIEGTLVDLSSILKNVTDFESYLQNLPADFPADFALISGGAVLTDSMESEAKLFEEQYLLTQHAGIAIADGQNANTKETHSGRPYIRRKMQEAFIHFGVWDFITKDLPVDKYTFKGDPLRIDFSYSKRETKQKRMLHAVSLVHGIDRAKILALSWPLIRDGLQESNSDSPEMFAIIEDERSAQSEQAKAAQNWLQDAGIHVRPVSQMLAIAQTAREDLKL
jgi:hypothetical protein